MDVGLGARVSVGASVGVGVRVCVGAGVGVGSAVGDLTVQESSEATSARPTTPISTGFCGSGRYALISGNT